MSLTCDNTSRGKSGLHITKKKLEVQFIVSSSRVSAKSLFQNNKVLVALLNFYFRDLLGCHLEQESVKPLHHTEQILYPQ